MPYLCRGVLRALAGAGLLAVSCVQAAHAVAIERILPQGTVSGARQVQVDFFRPAASLGQPDAPAPVRLQCQGAEAGGQGRWLNERRWVFDLDDALAAGVRCTVSALPEFRAVDGTAITDFSPHVFDTGGPVPLEVQPYAWEDIDEQQHFLVETDGVATRESVLEHVWCEAADVGERIPVRFLGDAELGTALKATWSEARAHERPGQFIGLACQRRFTPGVDVTLVWGAGVASPAGVALRQPERFGYTVRKPFSAEFTCQREQANKSCIPVLPMRLRFSAEFDGQRVPQFRLRAGQRTWLPRVIADDGAQEQRAVADAPQPPKLVSAVVFDGPFPANTAFTLEIPDDLTDDAGRRLANAQAFPLKVATGDAPALAKFASGDFAVIERFAEGRDAPALLPVTLRRVEAELPLRILRVEEDKAIADWMLRVEQFSPGGYVAREDARQANAAPLPPRRSGEERRDYLPARILSLLDEQPQARALRIPASSGNPQREQTEVVGIPLEPGYQVVEIASPILGEALAGDEHTNNPVLYARTAALVTNLSVHFKLGAENALAWVTSLDDGQPVGKVVVRINDCHGERLAEGVTDAQGRAQFPHVKGQPPRCRLPGGGYRSAYFVTARTPGGKDLGLVWSDWQQGIEPWRFNVPTTYWDDEDGERPLAHTVTDRALLRAGETVSMKHYLRLPALGGFATPQNPPAEVIVTHQGSGQEFILPLEWRNTAAAGNTGGGLNADSALKLPRLAPLGFYSIRLKGADGRQHYSGGFRVEEFRLPVFAGSLAPVGDATLVRTDAVDLNVQLHYVAGGAAANWPVQVSALLELGGIAFENYADYSFASPLTREERQQREAGRPVENSRQLLLDKKPLTLDAQGNARVNLQGLAPAEGRPQTLRTEINYADPNGEIQTLSSSRTIWPAEVLAGLKTDGWISVDKPLKLHAIALTPEGKPAAGVNVQITASAHTTLSTRKRLVGGFYQYDHQYRSRELGTVCQGRSDAAGRVECTVSLRQPGQIELVATVRDARQRSHSAATSVWVSRAGQLWFDAEASDRIDVLPEKPFYEPGETARFQVRMPFRKAQALVAVEREGVLQTELVELRGDDPSFTLKVGQDWSPNIYVSVLAVRGRLRDVPWYSFFTWGFKSPKAWWRAWRDDAGDAAPPTALVDLSKPAHRFGVAGIKVGHAAHAIKVEVKADKPRYATRETARLHISAQLPDGRPAAGAEIAVAVVDKALLELAPNKSWDLLQAMMRQRPWAVATATAQMEVLGRRHYGRKAVAAGGGGGAEGATRELFDTLALWRPRITLDAQGKAVVEVPLNDAITTFHAQVIADLGANHFGGGSAELPVAQDLQIISGLPPVLREGDAFEAELTLRNTTAQALAAIVTAHAGALQLEPQKVEVAAGSARAVRWRVQAPLLERGQLERAWQWQINASGAAAQDSIRVQQTILPAVPVTVRQASLRQLDADAPLQLQTAMPLGALEGRGQLRVEAQATLAQQMPGVQDWWRRYPYACLEQRASKSIGLMDASLWAGVAEDLPAYLDDDGLASYFPPRRHDDGSPILTAHLLAVDATLQTLGEMQNFRLDAATRQKMIDGLASYVQGRITRRIWTEREETGIYKLGAIAALAQHGAATPAMLESIQINPRRWPTHALIDWLQILHHLPGVPQREQHLKAVQGEIRARLVQTGVQTLFTTDKTDFWWWAMQSGDVNAARLLLATAPLPEWKDDMGALATGLIARQQRGAWSTTVANLWGQLALRRFSQLHEAEPVQGELRASLGGQAQTRAWPRQPAERHGDAQWQRSNTSADKLAIDLAWPDAIARLGDPENATRLKLEQHGSGKPWVTISSLAAVPAKEPVASGLQVRKTITPVVQSTPGQWSKGDIYRVHLEVKANAQLGITALSDPIPAGSTILGSGLGRDSALAAEGEDDAYRYNLAWVERKLDVMRVYYYHLPEGVTRYEYTVRLNQPGDFSLPPTRAEALYAPQVFGETPNEGFRVEEAQAD